MSGLGYALDEYLETTSFDGEGRIARPRPTNLGATYEQEQRVSEANRRALRATEYLFGALMVGGAVFGCCHRHRAEFTVGMAGFLASMVILTLLLRKLWEEQCALGVPRAVLPGAGVLGNSHVVEGLRCSVLPPFGVPPSPRGIWKWWRGKNAPDELRGSAAGESGAQDSTDAVEPEGDRGSSSHAV